MKHETGIRASVFIRVPEGYVAYATHTPGANAQGRTIDEARSNLKEAIALVQAANTDVRNRPSIEQI